MDLKRIHCVDKVNIDHYTTNVDKVDVGKAKIPREIYVCSNYFELYGEGQFFARFRLTKSTTLHLLGHIEHNLEFIQDKNNSISPINQLLITLRVYATGGHLISVGDFIQCNKSTVSKIVAKVSRVIASLRHMFIYMPQNEEKIAKRKNDFYEVAGFPKVIGAVDGSHVKINSQDGNDAEIFRNRKGYFSINVQAVASSNLLFEDIVARWPGSSHDSTIFNNKRIKYRFENGDFGNSILLGDSGYMNKPYLLTPFLNTQNHGEVEYNNRHIRTRVKVEYIFGVWKRRFPIMAYGCRLKLSSTLNVIVATAILHNIARLRGEPEPPSKSDVMTHELQQLIMNGDIPNTPLEHQNDAIDYVFLLNIILIDYKRL